MDIVDKIREEIPVCSACFGEKKWEERIREGRIPRGLYIEDPNKPVDIIIAGINPGLPYGYSAKPFVVNMDLEDKSLCQDMNMDFESLQDILKILKDVMGGTKRFNESEFYRRCYEEFVEEQEKRKKLALASQIAFRLMKNKDRYFTRLRELAKSLLQKNEINILWTNFVKCDTQRKEGNKIKELEEEGIKIDVCIEKFLIRELEAFPNEPIIIAAKVLRDLSQKIKKNIEKRPHIVLAPHPSSRISNDKWNKIIETVRCGKLPKFAEIKLTGEVIVIRPFSI